MNKAFNVKIGDLVCAVGHHLFFQRHRETNRFIWRLVDEIRIIGLQGFLAREYPDPGKKSIIINSIDGRPMVTDGNTHLVSIVLAKPDVSVSDLLDIDRRLIRFWENGWEDIPDKRYQPYKTYIYEWIDTNRLSAASSGMDYSKSPPLPIKVIPSDIPYDSDVFSFAERGKTLYETALALAMNELVLNPEHQTA